MSSSKTIDLKRDFAAGVYPSLQTGGDSQFLVYVLSVMLVFSTQLWDLISMKNPLTYQIMRFSRIKS